MLGVDLDSVRTIAYVVVAVLVVAALLSAWALRKVVSKLMTAAVLVGIALLVWSQRSSLDECADRVQATLRAGAVDETSCTFFGRDVTIPGRG